MSEPIIEFKNVSKIYKLYKNDKKRFLAIFFKRIKHKKKLANDNISFKIQSGESVAVFGRNGAGKSTMLKMISGVVLPSSGEINVNGRVSALLELTAGFDPEFTGLENVYLKGQLMGLTTAQIKKIEKEILDFAELDEYINQPVRTYSSGMKARLGFAINVIIEPQIFVVDEALSVGDVKFRKKCSKKMNEIIKRDHVTLIYVTHSADTALDICTRGMVLKNGGVIFDGDIKAAIEKYKNL
jgi:teichoic acid transport system ATP-binding protein